MRIAKRAAQEMTSGMIVNLGIGIPTLVADYIPAHMQVVFHAENGILGMGPAPERGREDPFLCNAGGFPVTAVKGMSYCDSAVAFAMIRRGRLDMTILGALEVSAKGDLANWIVPGHRVSGIGGAMELAQKAKKVVAVMNHVTHQGEPKIKRQCALPLTAATCVHVIITDMAVIEVCAEGLVLTERMAPYTIEDIIRLTDAELIVADHVTVIP
ncbi:3-oxoacid CoA-transferase subunit B [Paenibacillus sp. 481]|uniref:3-oxoacid CoA-transferase subunit B n=1 Tax=Paenibacillus sp. 481 TaxID=2835869 RepID=UPI0022B2F6B2|nr:3-oxoacid CoA-transferase subunit B [Paenibacillus sp. 481]